MSSGPNIPGGRTALGAFDRLEPHSGAAVFAVGLCVRLALIHAFPVIFGGDSVVRLVNSDKVLLSYQLPALQGVIYSLAAIAPGTLAVRYFMALMGAAAGLGAYRLGADLLGRSGGFAVGLLFATQPFLLQYSVVPYQEILMLAGLLFAFHFFLNGRWLAASPFLGLACLARYEAWIACPVLAAAFLNERRLRFSQTFRAVLLFGWAPMTWIVIQGGLSPAGTFVVDASFSLERFQRYVYLGWIGLTNTPLPVLLLAVAGMWQVRTAGLWRERGFRLSGIFVALFLAAVLFSAHGERDQPDRFVTAREAHIPLVAGVFLAAVGLLRLPKYRAAALGISAAAGLVMAVWFVHRETSEPRLRLSYETARYLDEHVRPGERAAVLARPLSGELLTRYLRAARERGGDRGVRQSVGILTSLDASPRDYQQTLVHSRLGKDRLLSLASIVWPTEFRQFANQTSAQSRAIQADSIQWLAVWSDFQPTNDVERSLATKIARSRPATVLGRNGVEVRLYRLE